MNSRLGMINNYVSSEIFYEEVKAQMMENMEKGKKLSIATVDIDRFNHINDLFGFATGDLVLEKLAEHFSRCLKPGEFFTRLHGDIFAFCIEAVEYVDMSEQFRSLANWDYWLKGILPTLYNMTASAGVAVVENFDIPVSALVDKANYARQKAKDTRTSSFRFYDDEINSELQWQKTVTFSMESALKNREFEMYLQPKIAIQSDQIVGAEALARWNSPEHGLVPPDRFIPILEQNGFIRQLDFFMLEEACRFLKNSESNKIPQLPISVNFSKVHLATDNLVERIFYVVNRLGVSTRLLEIEFTESISMEGFEKLVEIVTDLKLLGFRVSLDDFGSAYSSLSCLKELPIDIIKIDKGFLEASSNSEKGRVIISKVVEMIKSLRMLSVMEGVETAEQVEFLQKLPCDFGQGYFYAKPMPANRYIDFLKSGDLLSDIQEYLDELVSTEDKSYLYTIPQEFQMDNWELYTLGKNIDMGLMKGYLDGEATVQYVNDKALEYLGYNRQEFRELFNNSIVAFTHPDDAHIMRATAEQLITSGKPLQFQARAIRKDGKVIVLQGRSSCVIDSQGRPVGLYAFQDVTEELERTEDLRLSEERYRLIVEQSEDILFDWDFNTDSIFFSDQYVEILGEKPAVKNIYDSPKVHERVHPDDQAAFMNWKKATFKSDAKHYAEFRIRDLQGKYVWYSCTSMPICDEVGNGIRAVGKLTNINDQKVQLENLTYKSQRDPLTKLLNREEMKAQMTSALENTQKQQGAFFMIDIDNFKTLNDNLGHQLGDMVLSTMALKIQGLFAGESIVGRMGGDEFGAYLNASSPAAIIEKADELVRTLRESYYGSASKYNISGSIGVAIYPDHGQNFDDLYRFADIALYESKLKGKDRCTIYRDHMTGDITDSRTPVEWSVSFLNTYFGADFPFQIFEMLYETKDINASLPLILELVGKRFAVDRVYVIQNDPGNLATSNTYEWCGPGIPAEIDNLQHIPNESVGPYTELYSEEGVFHCADIRTLPQEIFDICDAQGIKSLLHCAIAEEGTRSGFVGFDMCREYHEWTGEEIATLGYLARILSVFLSKSGMAMELRDTYESYVEMVENLAGYVYVVDPNTYQVLYVNRAVSNLDLSGEKPCYEMAFGTDKPCEECPMRDLNDSVNYATREVYSRALNGWISAAASKMKWKGSKEAVLICCTDISKYKQID